MASFDKFYFDSKKKIQSDPGILLHPNIPKPLHTVNPRTILGSAWWNIQRQTAYEEHDYHCHACGIHKTEARYKQWLEGHEFYTVDYAVGKVDFVKVVALCNACHNYIHSGRLQALLNKGLINQQRFNEIIKHGELVLRLGGYKHFRPDYPSIVVEWSDWHMIINGKKYYSPFEDYAAWADYHAQDGKL